MKDLDKQSGLRLKIQQDFLERCRPGIWGHPVGMLGVLVTTGLPHRAPGLSIVFAASISLLSCLRALTIYRHAWLAKLGIAPTHTLHVAYVFACTVVWGVVPGFALACFGYHDQDVLILLLYQAAVAFAIVNAVVQSRKLIAFSLILLYAPPFVGSLLHGGPRLLDCLTAIFVYVAYCVAQGKRLNSLYLSQISDNFDLSVAAYRDCLTGLPNRLYMNHAMETCIDDARNRGLQIALLYIDLDGFKQINDRYSHKVGDLFLCEAASRIRQSLREHDIAARIGGDEFNILLPACISEAEAIAVATRVLADARLPVNVNGHQLNYSASIGVSLLPRTAENIDMLVRTADEAMYTAKSLGKDRICMQLPGGGRHILTELLPPAVFAMAV